MANIDNILDNATEGEGTSTEGTTTEKETYTKAEMEALLQSETDRRVSSAMAKKDKEMKVKVSEAEKLAKMNEEEKSRYTLEQREKALEAKERQLALSENKIEALKVMVDKGIPTSLVDFIVTEDATEMQSRINLFQTEIQKAVRLQVEKRLASPSPKAGIQGNEALTKESVKKMGLAEMSKLQLENPELFKQLLG